MQEAAVGAKKPLWTKNYILILVNNFFTFMIHFALFTNLPTYIRSMGGTSTAAGLSTTVYTIAALAARPVFGYLIDKLGRKKVIIVGMTISLITAVLYYFSYTISMVLAVRVLNGISFSALGTVIGTLVADNVPHERLSEGIGYSGISLTVATAIGPFTGAQIIKMFGYKALFIYLFVITCISFVCGMILKYKPVEKNETEEKNKILNAIFERTSLKPALVVIIMAISYGSVATFITSFGAERNLANVSIFFLIYALVALVARLGTARIADRRGVNIVFWPSLASLFIALVILSFTNGMPLLLMAAVFYGIGYGITFPMMNVMVMKVCPPNRRGAAVAMLYAGMDIGIGVGAMIWGIVAQNINFTAVYLLAASVVILTMIAYYILLHKEMSLSKDTV